MRKLTLQLTLIGSLFCSISYAQTGFISTFAGTGASGYTGDGGPAVEARLGLPVAVAADAYRSVYIVDDGSSVIRKVNSSGIITTIAGGDTSGYSGDGGPAAMALLNQPSAIAIDYEGNLFIADQVNNVVRKIDNVSGIITTVAGNGAGAGMGFGTYFSGDGGPATAAELNHPADIAIDATGNLYIADEYNSVVRKVDVAGIITTIAGTPDFFSYGGDGGPATAAKFNQVKSVAVDNAGNVYINDQGNYVIRKVNTSGIISTIAGIKGPGGYSGDGGQATDATIVAIGLTFDAHGNLYFSTGGTIRRIDPAGIITRVAGNDTVDVFIGAGGFGGDFGPATAARLNEACATAFDAWGTMYIADAYNARIRKVTPNNPLAVEPAAVSPGCLLLFPNPNKGTFAVKGSLNQKVDGSVSLQVMDMLGRVVYNGEAIAQQGNINAQIKLDDHLPGGAYMLNVFSNEKSGKAETTVYNFHFVIEK